MYVDDAGRPIDHKILSRRSQRLNPKERAKLFYSFELTSMFVKHGKANLMIFYCVFLKMDV